jgi:hypothetical protein
LQKRKLYFRIARESQKREDQRNEDIFAVHLHSGIDAHFESVHHHDKVITTTPAGEISVNISLHNSRSGAQCRISQQNARIIQMGLVARGRVVRVAEPVPWDGTVQHHHHDTIEPDKESSTPFGDMCRLTRACASNIDSLALHGGRGTALLAPLSSIDTRGTLCSLQFPHRYL